ncbi:hypothetical protein BBJ28_00000981 [Nothophytophthora sp. Chile5]|nr:hypothetical protein BBJ28_00000981 [Nothophytophthora sp. Chile5]
MVSLSSLTTLLAFSALLEHVASVVSAQGLIFAPLETPGCAATPAMVQAGHMAVTDPACLAAEDEPGCNLFGIQGCRACALMPGYVEDEVPPCDALEVFEHPAESDDWQPVIDSGVHSTESSDAGQYVPAVIDVLTDPFSATTSSSWTGSADNSDDGDDAVLDKQDGSDVAGRLRG